MTQEELARMIPIGREAVSKWERGKNKPDKSCLIILSDIFEVSVDEIILGRRIENNEVKDKSNDIKLNLYEENNKNNKIIKLLRYLLLTTLILFLGYYFISNYNSIKVYTINYSDEMITIKDGIFNTTREKLYFNLGNINSKEKIKSVKLYYKVNNKEKLICKTSDVDIMLYDTYGYNSYFNYKELKEILNNSYVDIEFDDKIHTIKLEYKKDFSNNSIFLKKQQKITESNNNYSNNYNVINTDKIKKNFKYKDDLYVYEEKNLTITYFEEVSMIQLLLKGKSNEEWIYYLEENVLDYSEYNNKNVLINSFIVSEDEMSCKIDNCEIDKEKINLFFDKLKDYIIKN